MVFLGELEHGIYDECANLSEDEVNKFYGFDQNGDSLISAEETSSDNGSDSDPEENSKRKAASPEHEAYLPENLNKDYFDNFNEALNHFDTSVRLIAIYARNL